MFGPVYSHVVLRPRPGYVPKVPTTPFRDQVVNLQALPSLEADPALALLCPVRALRIYVDRTRSFRSSEQLFGCHGGQQKGKAVSKQRLAHWIVETRLEFARAHADKDEDYWDSILWSDETKINVFGTDGFCMAVWRRKGEEYREKCIVPTVKHGGGSVLMWGCMSAAGVGELHFIDGIMNSQMYCSILKEKMLPSLRALGRRALFQHDNDPKHISKATVGFLKNNRVKVIQWPSMSPDLNPIEHLWGILKRQVEHHSPSSLQSLKVVVLEEWKKIDLAKCRQLVNSMPRRLGAVIKNHGGHTKY